MFVNVPAWMGLTLMVMTTVAFLVTLPMVQVTVASHVPWVDVADTKVVPAGSGSLTRRCVAALGPLFLIVTV